LWAIVGSSALDEKRNPRLASGTPQGVRSGVALVLLGAVIVALGVWIDRVAGICESNCAHEPARLGLGVPGAVLILCGVWRVWSKRA
jgi:hypothetical protein